MIIPPGTGDVILLAILMGFALVCLVLNDRGVSLCIRCKFDCVHNGSPIRHWSAHRCCAAYYRPSPKAHYHP